MLDIQFIRDNADLVQEKTDQKRVKVSISDLLQVDRDRRDLQAKIETMRAERNKLAEALKGGNPSQEQLERGRKLKDQIAEAETLLGPVSDSFTRLLKKVPNMPVDGVPLGSSEDDNVVTKTVGEKPKFDFEPRTHWQLAESKGWIDKERAAKVAGSRFAYLKGDLVRLQFAIIQFVIDKLTDSAYLDDIIKGQNLTVTNKPFVPVLPPYVIRTEVYDAMDRLEPRDDRYKLEQDDMWLQGSAEHVLGSMHMREDIPYEDLPVRYLGYATSFRREAGNYGKDSEGIFRMHQFDKLEMESITDEATGLEEHRFLVAIQEKLMQELAIPYQVIEKCTADIGKPNAKGVDINAWLPGQNQYRETHTADYMTDYQARRLNLLYRRWIPAPEEGTPQTAAQHVFTAGSKVFLAHTNDATAFALGRTMIAIIENYQDQDGTIRVPDVLQPYIGGKKSL